MLCIVYCFMFTISSHILLTFSFLIETQVKSFKDVVNRKVSCQRQYLHCYMIVIVVTWFIFVRMITLYTRVKLSQAITGLLAQQPCNSTVNMIEQDW